MPSTLDLPSLKKNFLHTIRTYFTPERTEDWLKYLAYALLLLGILLRLVYWWQDKDLFIDEVNVVRNLYERNYMALTKPLNYEQYAPPIFLWVEKTLSLMFGFGEKGLRLYSLLTGIAALLFFYKLALKYVSHRVVWYPLALMASGFMYIYYSAVVKQYMPDMLLAILLVWLASALNIFNTKGVRFVVIWVLVGSVAIWSSMSSVFILAAVGLYYFLQLVEKKAYPKIGLLAMMAIAWLAQFAFYYVSILVDQIHSDYLQKFHAPYFLTFDYSSVAVDHNLAILENLLGDMGGFTTIAIGFNVLLFLVGCVALFRQKKSTFVLLVLPVLFTILAAFIKQYTLIPRATLFMFPLVLLVMSVGLKTIFSFKKIYLTLPAIALCIINFNNIRATKLFTQFYGQEEITMGFDYFKEHQITANQVFITHLTKPAFIYYTTIHPEKENYAFLKNADTTNWDTNFAHLVEGRKDSVYFLYTSGYDDTERALRFGQLAYHMKPFMEFQEHRCFIFGFMPNEISEK